MIWICLGLAEGTCNLWIWPLLIVLCGVPALFILAVTANVIGFFDFSDSEESKESSTVATKAFIIGIILSVLLCIIMRIFAV